MMVEVCVHYRHCTELAIAVTETDEDDAPIIWLPMSQLGDLDTDGWKPGQVITIEVAEWLAKEKGLI